MAKNHTDIIKIYRDALSKITTNNDEFIKFIKFYSNFYKYKFQDALMIYAQRENSTAVATYKQWQQVGYQVKKGEKAMAIFKDEYFKKLKYVFDVSSTYQRKIKLWKYNEEKHKKLIVIENKEISVKDYFWEHKHNYIKTLEYNHLKSDKLKEFSFYINYIAKCNRMGINDFDDKRYHTVKVNFFENLKNITNDVNYDTTIFYEIFKSVEKDLREIETKIKQYERNNKNERVELQQGRTRYAISKHNNQRGIETGEIQQNSNEIYARNKTSRIHNAGDNEQVPFNIQPFGGKSTGNGGQNNEGEIKGRASTGGLEHNRESFSQENVTERSRGNNDINVTTQRPLQGHRYEQRDGTLNIEDNQKKEQSNVPFFISQNNENKKEIDTQEDLMRELIQKNIGQEVILDEKRYLIKKISKSGDEDKVLVESLENELYPIIVRSSSLIYLEEVYDALKEQQANKNIDIVEEINVQQDIEDKPEKEQNKVPFFVSSNYNLNHKNPSYPVGTNEKIQANLQAIKVLLEIESEGRLARTEEKEILANYVGWGGLPQIFENQENIKSPFIRENAIQLKELLADEEYQKARGSVLNAHFTPSEIIKEIYNGIKGFGYFENLNILEPSCGTGNFIGHCDLPNSKITGVELDSITGRIAKKLYPNAKIKINGFEKENFKEKSFDLVIGNVPFGDYSIYDKKYNKNNYLIHDYFINKGLDLAKPSGIVAVITSKGTLDKKDEYFRKEISKKAELIGAIRLPNNAFKKLAGTDVTSDILFFQKLENERETIPNWVHTQELKHRNRINNYFIENPHMILGELDYKTNRYGRYDLTVVSKAEDLEINLKEAINMLPKNIVNQREIDYDDNIEEELNTSEKIQNLESNSTFKAFRYKILNGEIYYKNDTKLEIIDIKGTSRQRLIGMITIRDLTRELIEIQLDKNSDESIFQNKLKEFNTFYDNFVIKYGYINDNANIRVFKEDDDIHFLTSLENPYEEGYKKGEFFFRRTIAPNVEITSVDNAKDGLVLSLNKLAKIDFDYIQSLYNKPFNHIIEELIEQDLIFLNPLKYKKDDLTVGWEIKSVYINGNVKEKLKIVENLENESPYFKRNIEKLKEVIPKDIDFTDIKTDIGSDLYKPEDMIKFTKQLLKVYYNLEIKYNEHSCEWRIYNKGLSGYLPNEEYGTSRMGALYIFEKILNNQEVVVKDEIELDDGKKRFVTNKDETIKVNEKKILIERAFEDFVHQNKDIRNRIEKEYNERFNNSINSNFDIDFKFYGLSYGIKLRPSQKRAIVRSILSPNNLLLDHEVGAGKTFIMIVSAMEKKRLKIANKPLLVVPNNIIGQFKNDFYKLYPNANILYTDEKSFQTKNRKRFLSKIAQNDYDSIIMAQSQFDLLKISRERQINALENEIKSIVEEMTQINKREDRLTVKVLERTKKSLETNLLKLMDSNTETILDFEELGVDALYIDEAHLYKNLFFTTKLKNVAGINQTNSQKALNLKMKIDYIEEMGGKVTFATGTPISNTMAEMFTMGRFLAHSQLKNQGLYNFDSWQRIYAKMETKIEISPTGTGFQTKTRFASFKNIPELMNFYNSFADVITKEMIDLPVPKFEKHILEAETPEELAREMEDYSERAEKCKKGWVDPSIDNLLKIVHEGKYAGLDIRHIDETYTDYKNSKVNMMVNKIFEIYQETMENKSVQVVFSDISTPKKAEFNIYDDVKQKLIEKGIKKEEIEFVHNAKNSKEREKMFEKVRIGDIRVILGSTSKMGAGTNFQNKLIALYHLDTPWRPSDLEQREGRIIRQGNENDKVKIFKCITKGSFDAYSWQILEQKQRFISQAKTGAITGREMKDIDDVTIDYAEIKALATGNPLIKRKMEIDNEIEKLKGLETDFRKKLYSSEKFLQEEYPHVLQNLNMKIANVKEDILYFENTKTDFSEEDFEIIIKGNKYTDKAIAGELLVKIANNSNINTEIGEYRGFGIYSEGTPLNIKTSMKRKGEYILNLNYGYKKGNIDLLDNTLENMKENILNYEERLEKLKDKKRLIENSIGKEFEYKDTLISLYKEKSEIEKSFDTENKNFVQFETEEIDVEQHIENEMEL